MDKSWKIQEKLWFFALLIFAGGFYGGYTYSLRGQVFANAQTANLVMMMLSIGKGNWGRALYSLAPFSAYLFGVGLSEYLRKKNSGEEIKNQESRSQEYRKQFRDKENSIHGEYRKQESKNCAGSNPEKRSIEEKLLLFEALICFLLGIMPASWPDQFCQLSLSFICAMQFNIFRKAEGIPMATTFCTNHIRQMGCHLTEAIFFHNEESRKMAKSHGLMLVAFSLGVLTAVLLAKLFGLYSIFAMTALHLFLWTRLRKAEIGNV